MQNKILLKIRISVFSFIAIINFSQTKAQDSLVVKTTADAFVYTGTGGNSTNYGAQKNICVRYGSRSRNKFYDYEQVGFS